jgi:hypothetical protein
MRLFDQYTPDYYDDYLDDLQPGDDVIVRQNGHEFVLLEVLDVDHESGEIFCEGDATFDIDGKCGSREIMLPTKGTQSQLRKCKERKDLVKRFDESYTPEKMLTAPYSSLQEVTRHVESR